MELSPAPAVVYKTNYSFINIVIFHLCLENIQMVRKCSEFDDSIHSGFILLLDAPSIQLFFVGWEKSIALIIQALLAALIVINSPIKMFRFSAL
jgi:hypothetical protein